MYFDFRISSGNVHETIKMNMFRKINKHLFKHYMSFTLNYVHSVTLTSNNNCHSYKHYILCIKLRYFNPELFTVYFYLTETR